MSCTLRRPAQALWILALAVAALPGVAAGDTYTDIEARLQSGDLRKAAEAAEKLTAADSTDCRAWYLLGESRRRLTDLDGALAAYGSGLKACPDDRNLLKAAGYLYDEREQYDQVLQTLGHLWSLDKSDPEIGSRVGAAAFRGGRCQAGRDVFDALLAAHPDRVDDRLRYAELLANSCRDAAAAEAQFQTLITANPGRASVRCAYVYMLADAGRVDDAVKVAQAALNEVTEDQGCLYAAWGRALELGADSLFAAGKVAPAVELYNQALVPLEKGMNDPVFGGYCTNLIAEVKYRRSPMEDLAAEGAGK